MFTVQTIDKTLPVPVDVNFKAVKATGPKLPNPAWEITETHSIPLGAPWYHRTFPRLALAIFLSSSVMMSTYMGYRFTLVLVPVAWMLPLLARFRSPRMSVRRVSQFLLGYVVSVWPAIRLRKLIFE